MTPYSEILPFEITAADTREGAMAKTGVEPITAAPEEGYVIRGCDRCMPGSSKILVAYKDAS